MYWRRLPDSNGRIAGLQPAALSIFAKSPWSLPTVTIRVLQSHKLTCFHYTKAGIFKTHFLLPLERQVRFTLIIAVYVLCILVGGDGVEPPEPEDNAFTARPATTYGISTQIYGRGGRTRTHDGLQASALEAVALAAMRLPYVGGRLRTCIPYGSSPYPRFSRSVRRACPVNLPYYFST